MKIFNINSNASILGYNKAVSIAKQYGFYLSSKTLCCNTFVNIYTYEIVKICEGFVEAFFINPRNDQYYLDDKDSFKSFEEELKKRGFLNES